jgi:hypothetical protein
MTESRFPGVLAGLCLFAGPLLFAGSTLAWEANSQGVNGGTLVVTGSALTGYGMIHLLRGVCAGRPRLAAVATLVAVLGVVGGTAFGVQAIYEGALGISHHHAVAVLGDHPLAANLVFWLPGPLFPAAVVLTGVGLALTRAAPRWACAVLCLAGLAFPAGQILREVWAARADDVLLLVAFGYLAARTLRPAS